MTGRAPLAVILGLLAAPVLASPITGRATVIDGDTLDIRGTRIRLHGIDAPESAQLCKDAAGLDYRCGQRAALALSDRIGTATITCEARDTDRYGRTVAVCRRAGDDLNAWLVAQGHAIAYRRFSAEYVPQEDAARAAKRGIWAGTFEEPQDWRRGRRAAGEEASPVPVDRPGGVCNLKGNIGAKGARIVHAPGQRDYERTRIDEKKGERWFCALVDAQAAGWRPAAR